MHYQRWQKYGRTDVVRPVPSPARDWLQANVAFNGDECLIWPFHIAKDGYGRTHHPTDGYLMTASRLMCILAHGEPPGPKYEAAHRCGKGNQGCCSPKHVYWATVVQNKADQIIHGTTNRGERQGGHKLTETNVHEIRMLIPSGRKSFPKIAERFGVSVTTIYDIESRKRWDWLT